MLWSEKNKNKNKLKKLKDCWQNYQLNDLLSNVIKKINVFRTTKVVCNATDLAIWAWVSTLASEKLAHPKLPFERDQTKL